MQAGCGTGVGRAHGHAPRQNSPCKPPIRHTPRKNSPSTPSGGCRPRQNSPSAPSGRCRPRQNSPSAAKIAHFGLFSARWAKNFARSTQAREAGRIFSRRPPPTSHAGHTHRYKTLPTQQKTPKSAQSTRAGRKLSRSRRKQATQGEFYPADHHTLATLGTLTGTKLSPHAPTQAPTGTKLSQHSKKHPNQPIRGEQGENYPGRDPLETQTTDAGRILSRRPPHTSHAGHTHWDKTLPALPNAHAPTKSHAIPSAPEPTTTQNVGISMIEFQSWKYSSGNCMRNCRASRKTAHKAGPVVIHRPRLVCISCISANASDYQARTERS